MAKFKPGDIVTATKDPMLSAMRREGFLLGEVIEVLDDTPSQFQGQFAINVLASEVSKFNCTVMYHVGHTIHINGRWFDLVTQ